MIRSFLAKYMASMPRWCYIHLTVSAFSFLILICNGIPCCLLGFIGNAVFNPFLSLFLFLSAFLLITEICYIPNGPLIYLLDKLSSFWLYLLQLHVGPTTEIPCAQPSVLAATAIFCAILLIMLLSCSYTKKSFYLVLLMVGSCFFLRQKVVTSIVEPLPCGKEQLYLIKEGQSLTIIDPGCLGRSLSAVSFVQYTLMPHIVANFGTHTIEHLFLMKPGKLTFDAALALMQKARIKHLYIPLWQGELSKSGLRAFMELKEAAVAAGSRIHRPQKESAVIFCNDKASLTLEPLSVEMKKSTIRFNTFCLCHTVDNRSVTFYPSQYKEHL
jgi:hypothetical protein